MQVKSTSRASLSGFPLCELHGCCEDWICSARLTPEADHAPRWARVRAAQEELLRGGTACREPMTVRMEGWRELAESLSSFRFLYYRSL